MTECVVHSLGNAGTQNQFAKQHEHGDSDDEKIVAASPENLAEGTIKRNRRIDKPQADRQQAQRSADGDGKGNERDKDGCCDCQHEAILRCRAAGGIGRMIPCPGDFTHLCQVA